MFLQVYLELLDIFVFEFDVYRGNTRGSGTLAFGVDIALQGILGVQEGKSVLYTFDISKTGYYFTVLGLDFYNILAQKYSDTTNNYAQTNQVLLNKVVMLYPYYRDPVSLKLMTEPPVTWTWTSPIDWTTTDRAAFIKIL